MAKLAAVARVGDLGFPVRLGKFDLVGAWSGRKHAERSKRGPRSQAKSLHGLGPGFAKDSPGGTKISFGLRALA